MSNYLRNRGNDYLLDDFFNDFFVPETSNEKHLMKTDIKENEKNFEVSVEMPGFDKNNIKMSLKNGYLTIEGHIEKNNDEEDKKHYIRKERYSGSVERSYYVGEDVKEEDIKASFKNGILEISIPKEIEKKVEEKKYIAIE